MFACNFVIGSANYFINALISALISFAVMAYLFIEEFRNAPASDKLTKECAESIIRFTEEHFTKEPPDALCAIFSTNTRDFTENAIVADVVLDSDNKPVTLPVCIAGGHGLELFATYAETHYSGVRTHYRKGSVFSVFIAFPLH